MIRKEQPVYFCSIIEDIENKIKNAQEIVGHKTGNLGGRNIIYPVKIGSDIINPKNLLHLKEKLDVHEILIIDRIKGTDQIISIVDHVNRSGQNFLRGKTPEGKLPQFPDMSKIYNAIDGFEQMVVHTIGVKRFKNQQAQNNLILSELVGLVAPVAHYVGIKIFALGSENIKNIINLL